MPAPSFNKYSSKTLSIEDRRRAPRHKAYAEAWLDPGGMEPALPCKVLDISVTGAKLAFEPGAVFPQTFTLHAGTAKHAARVVWRRQNRVGVEFEKQTRPYRESGGSSPPDKISQ